VYCTAHYTLAGLSVTGLIVWLVLSLGQRTWFVVTQRASAVNVTLLFFNFATLPVLIASISCFATQQCLGGPAASTAWEYSLFATFVYTPAFRLLDLERGARVAAS